MSSSSSSSSSLLPVPPASEPGKLFVGGISSDTKEELMKRYFGAFGEVREVAVIRDPETGRGKGFAFVQFAEPAAAEAAMRFERHVIDGRKVEVKRAKPRGEQNRRHQYPNQSSNQGRGPNRTNSSHNNSGSDSNNNHVANGNSMANNNNGCQNKIFVGGLPDTLTEGDFKRFFENFGTVKEAVVIYENATRRPRGFGFVIFDSAESFHAVLQNSFYHLNGKRVEVKIAVPRQNDHPSNGSHHNKFTSRNISRRHNDFDGYQGPFYSVYPQFSFYTDYPMPIYPPYHYGGYPMDSYDVNRHQIPSSSIPWRGQDMGALRHNVTSSECINVSFVSTTDMATGGHSAVAILNGNELEAGEKHTTVYSGVSNKNESNLGEHGTGKQTTGDCSVVINSHENNLAGGETSKQTTGDCSVVVNSDENNLAGGETSEQTTGDCSVVVNSDENNLAGGETSKQTTGDCSVVVSSDENNLAGGETGKKTTGDCSVVTNSDENKLNGGETGKHTTGAYIVTANSSENNLEEDQETI